MRWRKPGPWISHLSGFDYEVCADGMPRERIHAIYWTVLELLWPEADRFCVLDPQEERLARLRTLPGVEQEGDRSHILTGPISPETRAILLDPARPIPFSFTLYRGDEQLFFDEGHGYTTAFVATPGLLEQLSDKGVARCELIDLKPSHLRRQAMQLIQEQLLARLAECGSIAHLYTDPVRLSVSRPEGDGNRAVLLIHGEALELLAQAPDPACCISALWAGVEALAEPTDGYEIGYGPTPHGESGLWLKQLPPELRPYTRLPWTHRLKLGQDPAEWHDLVKLAAEESDRICLTIPPAGEPGQLLATSLYGLASQAPSTTWVDRLAAQALASGVALDREGERYILATDPQSLTTLMAGWEPTAGWQLDWLRGDLVWMECSGGSIRLHLDPSSRLATDPSLSYTLELEPKKASFPLPPWG